MFSIRGCVSVATRAVLRTCGYRFPRLWDLFPGTSLTDAFGCQRMLLRAAPVRMVADVGAHTGTVAQAYRRLFPQASVMAFEPDPVSCGALRERFRSDERVRVFQSALGERAGEGILHRNASPAANSLLTAAPDGVWWPSQLAAVDALPVAVTSLDEVCRKQGIEAIDILKIDTQGTELSVLRGAAGLLAARRIRLIYTEVILVQAYEKQYHLDELLGFLRQHSYHLVNLFNPYVSRGRLVQVDAIFVPSSAGVA